MLLFLESVSHALSVHDAKALERLLEQAWDLCTEDVTDPIDVRRMTDVLSRQLRAAEIHLGISGRARSAAIGYGVDPWAR